jgi:hypothetical protein
MPFCLPFSLSLYLPYSHFSSLEADECDIAAIEQTELQNALP